MKMNQLHRLVLTSPDSSPKAPMSFRFHSHKATSHDYKRHGHNMRIFVRKHILLSQSEPE